MDLVKGVLEGNKRATAKALSLVENQDPEADALLAALHHKTGRAHVIGMTGSPGSGKSTLTDRLIQEFRKRDAKVAVIAVDPSSPFSGGAILGDRIRMQHRSTDPGVFIRSIGTRGHLGGLSSSTTDAVKVLDAAGYDFVIVETVGVGQAEIDVVRLADTVVVVLVPGLGDDVQAVKAGVMEIADVFCVNKADLNGSDKVQGEVEAMMNLGHPDEDVFWWPPIVRTIADKGDGVIALVDAVLEHHTWSKKHGKLAIRREKRLNHHVRSLVEGHVRLFAFETRGELRAEWQPQVRLVAEGKLSPQDLAKQIIRAFKND